jgi:hypothetical protein
LPPEDYAHAFRMKGEAYTNAVRSAQMISGRDVQGPAFTLLEGSL